MTTATELELDVLIFGGGAAGLWLLDDLRAAGRPCLLIEAHALGTGQTVASQGIIHGGLKYTLDGLFNPSAEAIRQMPDLWRACLAGERRPDLSATQVRAEFCHLWRTGSIKSRLGMVGAKKGLVVAPVALEPSDRPAPLADCPGDVLRLDEQVVSPHGFLADLGEQHRDAMLLVGDKDVSFDCPQAGKVDAVTLTRAVGQLRLRPRHVVLTAGEGNAALRQRVGLDAEAMQRRPLHVVMLRGQLPALNGHCVDGAKTRVTITTDQDTAGRTVWQVGGQVSEDGVQMSPKELINHTRDELIASLPGIDLTGAEWATYRVDRAEAATSGGRRPSDVSVNLEGNIVTAWPTKLALAPVLAQRVRDLLPDAAPGPDIDAAALADWPRPQAAQPPWERADRWTNAQ